MGFSSMAYRALALCALIVAAAAQADVSGQQQQAGGLQAGQAGGAQAGQAGQQAGMQQQAAGQQAAAPSAMGGTCGHMRNGRGARMVGDAHTRIAPARMRMRCASCSRALARARALADCGAAEG